MGHAWFKNESVGMEAVLVWSPFDAPSYCGGVRTIGGLSSHQMKAMAEELTGAMDRKCLLAGLPTGGAKIVMRTPPDEWREAAFQALGDALSDAAVLLHTSGDYGTTKADLKAMGKRFAHVHDDLPRLTRGVGRSVCITLQAALSFVPDSRAVSRVFVEGLGDIGGAVARRLDSENWKVAGWDVDPSRKLPCVRWVQEPEYLGEPWVFSPCALGGTVAAGKWSHLPVVVCGGANNILSSAEMGRQLWEMGVWVVPDVLSSSGAVVEGIGRAVLGLSDADSLFEGLGVRCVEILAEAKERNRSPETVAREWCARKRGGVSSPRP